jgi:hypothetical protein
MSSTEAKEAVEANHSSAKTANPPPSRNIILIPGTAGGIL